MDYQSIKITTKSKSISIHHGFRLDKKNKISDENFMTLLYYVALTSGQPVKEVFADFMSEYIRENYSDFLDVLSEEEIKNQIIEQYKKEARLTGGK